MKYFYATLFFISICCFENQGYAQPIVSSVFNRSDHRNGYVAITMMFQNEGRFLREWIEYHKAIGVSHFYLYNNASDDNYLEILMPYILSGRVELFDLLEKSINVNEHNGFQKDAYNHALNLAKGRNEWLAIIDSDEFICMPKHNDLKKFLKSYKYARGIVMHWVMYGSSGIQELGPSDLQIEHLVYRALADPSEHTLYKSMVRPEYVTFANIHHCLYRKDSVVVYGNHERVSRNHKFSKLPIDDIRINHYWWRDEKFFNEVKRPRRREWESGYSDADVDALRNHYNQVYDPSMLPLVEKVKAALSK